MVAVAHADAGAARPAASASYASAADARLRPVSPDRLDPRYRRAAAEGTMQPSRAGRAAVTEPWLAAPTSVAGPSQPSHGHRYDATTLYRCALRALPLARCVYVVEPTRGLVLVCVVRPPRRTRIIHSAPVSAPKPELIGRNLCHAHGRREPRTAGSRTRTRIRVMRTRGRSVQHDGRSQHSRNAARTPAEGESGTPRCCAGFTPAAMAAVNMAAAEK